MAVDSSGKVYVTDWNNNRVQVFSSDGQFLTKWESRGTEDDQFQGPWRIAVDNSGKVYITDFYRQVYLFSPDGKFLTKWGSEGAGDGQFDEVDGIAVAPSGNVYITDSNLDRVQVFRLSP
jgi:DNA-binding beta-propeller fold protein YncE